MTDLHWNPAFHEMICVTWSDRSVAMYPILKKMKSMVGPAQPSLVSVSTYEFMVGLREGGDIEAMSGLWVVTGSKEGHARILRLVSNLSLITTKFVVKIHFYYNTFLLQDTYCISNDFSIGFT